jgi:hypothetical protein
LIGKSSGIFLKLIWTFFIKKWMRTVDLKFVVKKVFFCLANKYLFVISYSCCCYMVTNDVYVYICHSLFKVGFLCKYESYVIFWNTNVVVN